MRIWPVSVITLSLIAIPVARGRGQEPAPTLSGPSFLPDGGGATLAGWHTLGQADWHADHGEIIGKGTAGAGWLVLDRSFQDTGVFAAFQCAGPCDTGVLLRCALRRRACREHTWRSKTAISRVMTSPSTIEETQSSKRIASRRRTDPVCTASARSLCSCAPHALPSAAECSCRGNDPDQPAAAGHP
jgi:hypothetical protein